MNTDSAIYYDPCDFDIDANPYPIRRRTREEAPLYYNDRHDFYALGFPRVGGASRLHVMSPVGSECSR